MVIEKLTSHNKSEYVYDQIAKAIESGQFGIGDRLPPELELAEMAGVSRASVREALSALRLVGVIETKKGNGTYIKANKFEINPEKLVKFDGGLNTFEMLEARRIVEPAVAKLALEVMDEKHLEKIKDAFDAMEIAAKQKNFESYHHANKLFHYAISDATKNKSLINYVHSLQNVFIDSDFGAELRHKYLTEEGYIKNSVDSHRKIYEAFVAQDGQLLDKAWQQHNEGLENQLLGK